ncbi:MAG: prephenate dehydrogenase [Sulfurimonas sp. RIFCSPHIGHO2_12_FULL_36_9]|uniref:prephenate dehydrogenase n=1 Tax=Sulfurimonas sp. RIFCSPLOWO2_12_36_12 TaxID=1802253 RepID=UPI0008BCA911|nr:prephenate dehydrogenase [Sulfurimonas sp. RIFCSPLOWO2_12_36_12]OHD96876.1 MAG: prephenate dehydrogenase [Sulfurimonas sp. RIFCSPHIGHO2_12_FULL_36_9]OHD99152.1 MAG: prephenate dehydrogenase [Sulfurimonas sp. RIFCSPLOWO2_02_FULL_36_28]OHE00019.1 MAG: prephenate dehydrogenase [Sulfurimonas sp. RIFCSPLOWO2_12_36_12]OHE07325.1 MAG: prephenate dehydrogenase [Sulfurimonas sp. RIFCSPLOWO2_12_FULL_36_74]
MNVAIIGLGLMGGSLAKSLKKLDFIESVVGSDHNEIHQKEAMELALVDKIVAFSEVKDYDVIFLAIPVDGVISALKNLIDIKENATIIDLGSTKAKIVDSVPLEIRKNFVAAHPMTGTENFGPRAAVDDLYDDKVVVLCDLENSGEAQVKIAKKIFKALNMKKHFMSASQHDRHAAFISHMPHAISYSLANTVMHQENKHNILALAAGGFRSMSRLAKSSANMWEDIFRQNKTNLLEAIELFEIELNLLKKNIENEEWDKVHKYIEAGNRLHDILD